MFATLTAPSFGPVHSRRMRGKTVLPCRPRRDANARRCPHGRDISCPRRHGEDDPRLGRPLCGDCYDYDAAVLFNAYAGDLWRRFTTYLPRHFARLAGLGAHRSCASQVAIRYVKVAEYQARGVVHFHAIIRLDAPGDDWQPPGPALHRRHALRRHRPGRHRRRHHHRARPRASPRVTLRFGTQTDARPVRHGGDLPGTGQRAVGPGGRQLHRQVRHQGPRRPRHPRPAHPLRARPRGAALLPPLPADDHHRVAARRRQAHPRPAPGCASGRTCSATAATSSPNPAATPPPSASSAAPAPSTAGSNATPAANTTPGAAPSTSTVVLVLHTWTYAGTGYTTTPGAELALASAAMARAHRQAATAA